MLSVPEGYNPPKKKRKKKAQHQRSHGDRYRRLADHIHPHSGIKDCVEGRLRLKAYLRQVSHFNFSLLKLP